ncbi:acyltransferase family protein [Mycolicibacterium aichiense]|uniref:Acyltransferase n=1 Tax=Mycolicibacterium aichiense TaxID=1799 RepID=A0AAD1MC82_9MYCO|nr:acyltransferase family protein [Mycolicibacterium aichiense]MCV7019252.1 acyltransferase [Mycolicibacterium aichiense]BBX09167.1 acyltransferase [Mycolicibacterium aichiense]SUA13739.1 peptidoglycan O-acetyl transferase yrhL [Mycolicibacterium aichiense]
MGKPGFRADIEGLRAVAVLAVVLFHAEVPGIGGGFVGVDVFFVISGFLITGLLWREANSTGTVRLRGFYGARARRLLPASALVGVVTAIGAAVLLPPLQARTAFGDGIASALYVSNYRFLLQGVDYSAPYLPPSPFLHYWSLGVEEQFYLVWPALILGAAWLIRRSRRRTAIQATASVRPYLVILAVVAVISLAMSLVASYWAPFVAFFSLPTRAWQLAVGGLIALTAGQWRRLSPRAAAIVGCAGLAVILVTCRQLSASTLYPGTAALWPTLGTAMIIGAGCAAPDQGCGRLLGAAPMRSIGRISYSWYLWHWPVLIFAPLIVGHSLGLAGRLTAALLSAGLAVLTLRFVENPLRFAPKIRESPWRSLGLGAVTTAVAAAVGVALLVVVPTPVGRGAPARPLNFTALPPPIARGDAASYDEAVKHAFAEVQSAVAASVDLRDVPSNLQPPLADAAAELNDMYRSGCMLSGWQVSAPECASGDTASTNAVAVVGDSNAAMWNQGFRAIAEQRGWRLEMVVKAGCPLLDLPITSPQLHREYTECEQWRGQVVDRFRAEHPKLIVVTMWRQYGPGSGYPAGLTSYSASWNDSLTRLVRQLRDAGAQVLVLGPIPDPHSVPPICLSGHLADATACSASRSRAVDEAGIAAEAAATTAGGGQYADITDLFCTAERCPAIVGNTLVYLDKNHLTIEYVRLLAPALGALADRALAIS